MSETSDAPPEARAPRMRKSSSSGMKADYFYQQSSVKRGGAYVSITPGRNTQSSLPWRLGVRLFELDVKQSSETYLKLQVEDGHVERTSVSKGGALRPWDAHTSLWVGDPDTDHMVVKAYAKASNNASATQIGTPFKIPIEAYKWAREDGRRMPEFQDHAIPDSGGGRVRMQLVCVQAKPNYESPKLNILVGTWNVGNEPPPADLTNWLDVGDVDRVAMPTPPPDPPKELIENHDDPDADGNVIPEEEEDETMRTPTRGKQSRNNSKKATPQKESSAQKKLNKKLYAQPAPTLVPHELFGVSPKKFGTYDMVVVGCQEGDYSPRDGFKDCESDWLACVAGTIGDSYYLMSKYTLGQMRVAAFVRADVAPATHRWHYSTEATGIGHIIANKGGVGVSCKVWDTSLCFINSHLAAHVDMEKRRNDDFAEIVGGCLFGEKVECTQVFHHLIWFGDLNYRCEWGLPRTTSTTKRLDRNPPKERVRRMIKALTGEDEDELNEGVQRIKRNVSTDKPPTPTSDSSSRSEKKDIARRVLIFETDQLTVSRKRGDAFMGFEEGNPAKAHMPTFKVQREKGFVYKEQRTPAWCDRVLWKTAEGYTCDQTFLHAAGEIGTSDHKAVACGLEVEIVAHTAVVHFDDDPVGEAGETPRGSFANRANSSGSFANQRGKARREFSSDNGSNTGSSFSRGSSRASSRREEDDESPFGGGFSDVFGGDPSDPQSRNGASRKIIKTVPSLPNSKKKKGSEEKKHWMRRIFGPCLNTVCGKPHDYEPEQHCDWQLRFQMLQGKNLVASDINGYSDPYVMFFGSILSAPPIIPGKNLRRWRTQTIVANLNPRWRCGDRTQVPKLPLLTVDPAVLSKEHLLFRVMDEDTLTMDDPIGYGRLFLGPLANALVQNEPASIDTVVPLTQFGRIAGELKITVTLERIPRKTKFTKDEVSARKAARRQASGKK